LDTLVHDPYFDEVPRFFGLTSKELIAANDSRAWIDFEHDLIDEAALARRFFRDGRAVDQAGLRDTMRRSYRWLPGMEALVTELHARGVEMHALSNYPRWYELIEDAVRLSRFVAWTFVSCRTGLRKPDPRAFRFALAALGLRAPEVVFVDDRADNCRVAADLGLVALHFRSADALEPDLAARGLLP
jgi:FMN hydrolase / 5-amino-6-(5-phospho-D-ribitylamino)uracil phosphatase